jgi:hypothetical protein
VIDRERQADRRPPAPTHAARRAGPAPSGAIAGLQRSLSNRQLARLAAEGRLLARDPNTVTPPRPPRPSVPGPWGDDLVTAEQLAAYYRMGAASILDDIKGLRPSKDLDERARLWVEEVQALADALAAGKQRPLTQADVTRWETMADEAMPLRTEIDKLRKQRQWEADEPARQAARAAAAEAKRVADEALKLAPKIDDTARMAFKSGDESLLTTLADITGNITDIGLGIHELARQIAEKAAEATGAQLAPVGKYTEALNKLNKGLAAINLALSLAGEKGKTELDEGLRWVGISAGAFSSLGTLVGLPAHMGLYANLYLVPLTKACIAGVQRIAEYVHIENKSWVELTGEPGNYFVEPGGKPMWDFMIKVMKAERAADVPTPASAVADYFVDHAGSFKAGIKGHAGIPTTGWIWKDLDTGAFQGWIFAHRRQVWAMLYGHMSVPRP